MNSIYHSYQLEFKYGSLGYRTGIWSYNVRELRGASYTAEEQLEKEHENAKRRKIERSEAIDYQSNETDKV